MPKPDICLIDAHFTPNLQGNRGPMSVIMDILALLMQCSVFFIITRYQTRDKTFLTDLVDMVHVVAAMVLISLRQVIH